MPLSGLKGAGMSVLPSRHSSSDMPAVDPPTARGARCWTPASVGLGRRTTGFKLFLGYEQNARLHMFDDLIVKEF